MKKFLSYILSAVFAFKLCAEVPAFATFEEKNSYNIPDVGAFVLMEAETGEVLMSQNPDERLPISSLAKLMALLIIAEELKAGNITMNDNIPASVNASKAKGSVIWLEPGEVMLLSELVKAVVIASSNDATIALAEYIEGGTKEFTARMNARADELNMNETFFADCGGFSESSYSTARDVGIMSAELLKYNMFANLFTVRLDSVRTGTELETQLVNTNKMAHWYEGILLGKAGQSAEAGFCLVNAAERGNMRLITVVLSAKTEENRVDICEFLLNSGFKNFEYVVPELDASKYSPVKVKRGVEKHVEAIPEKPVSFIIKKGEGSGAKYEFIMPESIAAPVEKGQAIGSVIARIGDKKIAERTIVAASEVEELTFVKSFTILFEKYFRL